MHDLEAVDGLQGVDRGGQVALDADDEAGGLVLATVVRGAGVLGSGWGDEREEEQAGEEGGQEMSVHGVQGPFGVGEGFHGVDAPPPGALAGESERPACARP